MEMVTSQKLKYHRVFSILTILTGVILMTYMITVEDEPGLLPILLVTIGSVWLIFIQTKLKKQNK